MPTVRKTFVAQMFGDGLKFKDLTDEQKKQYINARVKANSKRPHRRSGQAEDQDADIPDEKLEEEQTLVQELFGYEAKIKNLTREQRRQYDRVVHSHRYKVMGPHTRHGTGRPGGDLTGPPKTFCEQLFGKGMRIKDLTLKQHRQYDRFIKYRKADEEKIVLQPGQI